MYSAWCGTSNDDAAAHCVGCRHALTAGTQQAAPSTKSGRLPTAANEHRAVPDMVSTMLPHVAPHRRRTFWIAMLVGLAVLGAWGVLALWLDPPAVTIGLLAIGAPFAPVLFVFFNETAAAS